MNFDFAALFGKTPEEVVKHFNQRELLATGGWKEIWQDAHARSFTVANVLKKDVLEDLHAAVKKVVVDGVNPAVVERELKKTLKQKGWWSDTGRGIVGDEDGVFQGKKLNARRVKTILHTNMAQTYHAANYQKQTAVIELKPWRRYNHHPHTHPRANHAALNGMLFRQDDPFWDTHMPQNGWGCHCDTAVYSERDIAREGWTDLKRDGTNAMSTQEVVIDKQGTKAKVTTYTDPVTGVEVKPDVGFNYNPGRVHYQPDLRKATPDLAKQYVQASLRGPDFKRFHQKAESIVKNNPNKSLKDLRRMAGGEMWPVAVLDAEHMAAIGAKTSVVQLSDETLVKQVVNREGQEIGLVDYWRVQGVLEQAQVVVKQGDVHLLFFMQDGVWYNAVVKATLTGDAVFLQSFRRSNENNVNKAIKTNHLVFDKR